MQKLAHLITNCDEKLMNLKIFEIKISGIWYFYKKI